MEKVHRSFTDFPVQHCNLLQTQSTWVIYSRTGRCTAYRNAPNLRGSQAEPP